MQDDGLASTMVEPRDAESANGWEGPLGNAMLPVLLTDAVGETAFDATDDVSSEELRGLLAVIQRLQNVVEEETTALETGQKIDFDDFSTRKSRSMLEFVRLMRAWMHLGGEAQITEEIQKLRQKLERNRAVLEMHFEAVSQVSAIIVKAIREAESDGTYSAGVSWAHK
jgi:flagellar biosynthesis/type III secretory pathway chaperone